MVPMGSDGYASTRSLAWVLLTGLAVTTAQAAPPDEAEKPNRAWQITPSLELAEIYSDNINLARSGREESDFITEISPAISVTGESARVRADAHYRIQNLFYVKDPSRSAANHQFAGRATTEAVEDKVFVDTEGTYSQVLVDPSSGATSDNINTPPRQDVYTARISPYYLEDLGGYARLNTRYSYGIARYETNISDSDVERFDVGLSSGRRFTRFGWSLSYYDETIDRPSGASFGDVQHQVALAQASYAITNHLSVLARVGDEQHDYEVARVPFENGTYAAGGVEWRPNRRTRISALYGDKYRSASLDVKPSSRTNVSLGWRDTDVGVNIGQAWNANMSLRTRRTLWAVRYSEEPATVQQLVLLGTLPVYIDPNTEFDPDGPKTSFVPLPGYVFRNTQDFFAPVNEEFIRKRGSFVASFHTNRTTARAEIFDERREYLQRGDEEQIRGVQGSANWRFLARTSYLLSGSFVRSDLRVGSEFDLWRIETGLSQQLSPRTTGSLSVSHTDRGSSGPGSGYTENRITLRLLTQF